MSSFNLGKKLLPAKKAWKSFKITLQTKLKKISTSKSMKRTKSYCIKTLNKIRVLIPCKLKSLIKRSLRCSGHHSHHRHRHHQQYVRKIYSSAIHVDDLFPGQASSHDHSSLVQPAIAKEMAASCSSSAGNKTKSEKLPASLEKQHHKITTTGVNILEKGSPRQGCEASTSALDAWKIPLSPQLRCVDERAEEFISKVRQEMKLQREQSIIDFHDMLARGT